MPWLFDGLLLLIADFFCLLLFSPFFGEEFEFEVPRRFRYLSVYAYDRDKSDKVVGKIALKREELTCYNNKDHWFPLRQVDADSEVQGKCHVGLRRETPCDSNEDKIIVR